LPGSTRRTNSGLFNFNGSSLTQGGITCVLTHVSRISGTASDCLR